MDIFELEQELGGLLLEIEEYNKIPKVSRTNVDLMFIYKLTKKIDKIKAKIRYNKNKDNYYNPENIKKRRISLWKSRGTCSRNWDNLYNIYLNTVKCNNCNNNIEKYNKKMTLHTKVLHHDHNTGKPIAIVCNLCNIRESSCFNFSIKQNENIF